MPSELKISAERAGNTRNQTWLKHQPLWLQLWAAPKLTPWAFVWADEKPKGLEVGLHQTGFLLFLLLVVVVYLFDFGLGFLVFLFLTKCGWWFFPPSHTVLGFISLYTENHGCLFQQYWWASCWVPHFRSCLNTERPQSWSLSTIPCSLSSFEVHLLGWGSEHEVASCCARVKRWDTFWSWSFHGWNFGEQSHRVGCLSSLTEITINSTSLRIHLTQAPRNNHLFP